MLFLGRGSGSVFTANLPTSVCNLESLSSFEGNIDGHVSTSLAYGTSFMIELLIDVDENRRLTFLSVEPTGLNFKSSSFSPVPSLGLVLVLTAACCDFDLVRVSCREISCTMYGGVLKINMPSCRIL
jgi:hypothetical protein